MTQTRYEATVAEAIQEQQQTVDALGQKYNYGWHNSDEAGCNARQGSDEDMVRYISPVKNEPEWMLKNRLRALWPFERRLMPVQGPGLSLTDFDEYKHFACSTDKPIASWDELPGDIKNTYGRLGIPEAEKVRPVAGVAVRYEPEVVYNQIRGDLESQDVVFFDTDSTLKQCFSLFREHFGIVAPAGDNRFASLDTAVWSGGSSIYIPKGMRVDIPLQAYLWINTEPMGQFERTLIIADGDSYVYHVGGYTTFIYQSDSLHSAITEIIVKKGTHVRYTTIQNWLNNVFNPMTQRAAVAAGATMGWVDGNIGSRVNMKYPSYVLLGEHVHEEALSAVFAGPDQYQDAGVRVIHLTPHTTSSIISKSISRGGGRSSYHGLVQIGEETQGSKSSVVYDALLVDDILCTNTYPYVGVRTDDVEMGYEATVSKVSEDQLFYLQQRRLSEEEAMAMVVRSLVESVARELLMEYALEFDRLVGLQMEGGVG